jgi:cytochrome c553
MLKRNISVVLAALLLAAFATPVTAAGDVERGAELADTCLGCHGIPGYRNAYPSYRVPKLGGLDEDYIAIALGGYKAGMRAHPTMQAQAASLSDQDMKDLAAYFASQGELEQGKPRSGASVARGQEKAAVCAACHGQNGVSATGIWPTLAGQHEDYLKHALSQYKSGDRKDPVMTGQAMNLSERDIADLAAYFAAQPGLYTVAYGN